jgi:hypothetical protein
MLLRTARNKALLLPAVPKTISVPRDPDDEPYTISSIRFRLSDKGSLIVFLFSWGSTHRTAGALPHKAVLLLEPAARDQWIAILTADGARWLV